MRKFTKHPVLAATEVSDGFKEAADNLQADFDYAVDGFEKLARDGKEGERLAMQFMLELNSAVKDILSEIASNIE